MTVPERPDRRWRAWHVFAGAPSVLDRLLTDVVDPEVKRLPSDTEWFFLRYWENGYHVRFRVLNVDAEPFAEIGDRMRSAAEAIVGGNDAIAGVSLGGVRDGWHADPSALPMFAPGTTVEILYEPEYRRYGGIDALVLSERLFRASSAAALAVVAATLDQPGRREQIAIALTAAAIGSVAAGTTATIAMLEQMATTWRSVFPSAEEEDRAVELLRAQFGTQAPRLAALLADGGASAPPLVQKWRAHVSAFVHELRLLAGEGRLVSPLTGIAPRSDDETEAALQSVVLSHVHMTNNRLGFSPAHEYRFARILQSSLEISLRP